jgi:hypothetical protein
MLDEICGWLCTIKGAACGLFLPRAFERILLAVSGPFGLTSPDKLKGNIHVSSAPIPFRCARGCIVHLAARADSSTITHSTDTAATAKVSSEMYRQWHLCQQQGKKGEAPRELLGSASRRYRSMPRWKL